MFTATQLRVLEAKTKRKKKEVGYSSLAGVARPGILKATKNLLKKRQLESANIEADFERQFDRVDVKVLEVSPRDATAQKATVVLIEAGPGNRVHRHFYTNELLASTVSAGKFEGRQCYANHPGKFDSQNRPERDVKDLLGFFKDARIQYETATKSTVGFKAGEKRAMVVADFYPEVGQEFVIEKLRTAALYNKLFPDEAGYVGWSIVAGGASEPKSIDGSQWKVVSELAEIDSIDMVTRAGAGGRLLTYTEAHMKLRGIFGNGKTVTESDEKPDLQKLKESLAAHVVESLGKVGVKPTSAQTQLIEAGVEALPSALLTPSFIMTVVAEAGVEVPEDQTTKLEEALGVGDKGKLSTLIESISEADEAEEAEETEEAADPNEPDDDDKPADKAKKEAAKRAEEAKKAVEAAKDPMVKHFIETLSKENTRLAEALARSEKLRESSDSQNKKSLGQLREVNARNLLAKSKLEEAQKEAIFEDLAQLPTGEQAKSLSKFETLFASKQGGGSNPAHRFREAASGGKITINAMRD